MTVLARPNHPARLAGVFAFSVLAFGLVAAAAGAVFYIIENERGPGAQAPASGGVVELPAGMVQIRRVDGVAEWKDALGFKPLFPKTLPERVTDAPAMYLQQPDAQGRSAGHVRYMHDDGSPAVVLVEQQGTIATEPPLKTGEASGTRMHVRTFACGSLVIQAQLYFQAGDGELPPIADTTTAAEAFIAGLRDQCE